jgi:hypothetical protein
MLNFFSSLEFGAVKELNCEHLSSQVMALGFLIAIASTGSSFFIVIFFFFYVSLELSMSLTVRI